MSLLNEINEIDFSKHTEYFRTQKIFNTGKSRQVASFFKVGVGADSSKKNFKS